MGFIYMLTNKVTGKRYIGQTLQLDINKRWQAYKSLTKTSIGNYLYNALVKWGVDNFKFHIVCVCFDDDCNAYEIKYISMYNTIAPHGYNLQSGGNNYKAHPLTIEKMRASMTGRKGPAVSDKEKEARRLRTLGVLNPNFGKKMTDEQRKKISETRKQRIALGLYSYEKGVQPKGLAIGRDIQKKKVAQYHGEKLIAVYDSISEAARAVNGAVTTVSRCADEREQYKHYKTHKGFIWKLVR